ncbi:MAG: hypothetical protein QHH10_04635 [Peptococcaceae bacterium]|nr:hypothetical protein [Peptococcaceae bacterium]MDH7524584.1 hypothetical protein [Peptococcaceae bacterium]
MASLRFSFDGERRQVSGHSFGWRRPSPFPCPGSHRGRGLYPVIYPVYVKREDRVERENCCEDTKKGAAAKQEVKEELDKALPSPEGAVYSENEAKEIKEGGQEGKKDSVVSASEKLIAFLETAETGLVGLKAQASLFRHAFNEIMFKLDSFAQLLDIIRSNEERKTAPPEAALSLKKETKDTLDEILEILQTPAFQGIMRQLALNFIVKK